MSGEEEKKGSAWLLPVLAVGALALTGAGLLYHRQVNAGNRSQIGACVSNLKNIGTALEMYSTDNGGHYPPTMERLTPNYLRVIPQCPTAASVTYRLLQGKSAPRNSKGYGDYYYIECHGGNHAATPGDFPAYTSLEGLVERADAPMPNFD